MAGIPYYFGEIAIQEGYIDEQILDECLKAQKLYRKPTALGEILKERKYLLDEHITRILKIQSVYRTKLESEYFANLAFQKKYLTALQLRELRNKFSDDLSDGTRNNIAMLALERGFITQPMIEEILKSPDFKDFTRRKMQDRSTLANYELVGTIIKLRKSTIYRAIQIELDRLVAVKVLLEEYEKREYIRSFFEEAKATAKFNHPNLVRIYDTGYDNGRYYYAMELVEGDNLAKQLENEGRLSVSEAVWVIRQIAQALEHIHSYKYIHAAIHPRNIVIREDKVAKLLDLGSSCEIGKSVIEARLAKMPQYTAPEQLKVGEKLDVRTDIYCLGATFYRILSGKPPISGKTVEEIRQNILQEEPKSIKDMDHTIPDDVAKIIHRMLRKDPQKRYPEIKNVLFALKKILL